MKKLLLLSIIIILLFPLYWMFTGSLQDIRGIMKLPPSLFPADPKVDNYLFLFENTQFFRWSINTVIITAVTVFLSVLVSMLAGTAFSVYVFTGKHIMFWLMISTIMISRYSLLISTFVAMKTFHLSGTWGAVIFPLVFTPIGILIAKNYIDTIPRDYYDSARMEGAGELRIFTRIVLPLCKPVLAALCLFKAVEVLGDYIWQGLVLQKSGKMTLIVGLIQTIMTRGGDPLFNINPIGRQLAVGVILFIPLFVIFMFTSRFYIQGISGGIKA